MVPRRRAPRAPHPRLRPLERGGHGREGQQARPTASAGTWPPSPVSAALYEVGFNHFFRGKDDGLPGDQVYFQGHAAPGIYARAFLEGRLTEEQLDNFRQEVGGNGLSSYPHPRLMPELLGVPHGVDGARAHQRRSTRPGSTGTSATGASTTPSESRVWCFVGDGECDEPETLGAISLAAREQLDNLTWVDQLQPPAPRRSGARQRQDHPGARGGLPRAPGWNVIKVIWGSKWDELLARDVDGVLLNKMNTTVDGEFQKYAVERGAYIREHFFGPDPRLRKMVEHLSDEELRNLPRGGHDYQKLYAAYRAAVEHEGAPTVILAKTIKGWTLGPDVEGRNATHQIKKMTKTQLRIIPRAAPPPGRDPRGARWPTATRSPPYFRPPEDSPEYEYMMERRRALDGRLPDRDRCSSDAASRCRTTSPSTRSWPARASRRCRPRWPSPGCCGTCAATRTSAPRVVPIIPDEARTFGMDALFREVGIYASQGQIYEPVDPTCSCRYTEAKDGQILEEGITEAGSMASFTAAGTAYATRGVPMVPFFIFYSMFGFQRVGDLIWSAADARARGFLLGATAGRTTLLGEGLQHQDGHSLVLASTVPTIEAYDPAFAYELGVHRASTACGACTATSEDVFYYLTLYNENYVMPAMPEGIEQGICEGSTAGPRHPTVRRMRATMLFSGTAQGAAREAQRRAGRAPRRGRRAVERHLVQALREEALSAERWNRLHPGETARTPYVTEPSRRLRGPFVAVTDFMKAVPDQVARWVPGPFVPLGTDGFGRSDTREALRRHFETDAANTWSWLSSALAEAGEVKPEEVRRRHRPLRPRPGAPDPRTA